MGAPKGSHWHAIDRLLAKDRRDVEETRLELAGIGWRLNINSDGLWVAHSRTLNLTVRATSNAGLLAAVVRAERGGELAQEELPLGAVIGEPLPRVRGVEVSEIVPSLAAVE